MANAPIQPPQPQQTPRVFQTVGGGYQDQFGNSYNSPDQVGTVNGSTGLAGTMTANITNPSSTTKTPAPAVVTSSGAKADYNNKQTEFNKLQNDVSTANLAKPSANTTGTSGSSGTPPPSTTSTTGNQPAATGVDAQINDLITSLGQGSKDIQDKAQPKEDALNTQISDNAEQQNNAWTQTAQKLQAISSGVYPLSPTEQSLLAATTQQFQSVITAQTQANNAYTGQMTELMASLGISTSAPVQAIGMIHAAISEGNDKIADLNSKMAISLGNLSMGFQKQDFDMVQEAWTDTAKQFEDRTAALKDMLTSVTQGAKDAQTELQDNTKIALTAITDKADIAYKDKLALIEQAKLAETIRHDQATEIQNNLQPTISPVGLGANGKPNPQQQAQFLQQFPADIQNNIKKLAAYQMDPSSFPTLLRKGVAGVTRSQILGWVQEYDPGYDQAQYATRSAMQKNVTSGNYSQAITAANTAIQHLAVLTKNFQALGNTGMFGTILNPIKNTEMTFLGSGSPNAFKVSADAIASELSKLYKGAGAPAESEIKNWRDSMSVDMSPDAFNKGMQTAMELLGGKLSTISDNYSSAMGQPPGFNMLTDSSAKILQQNNLDPNEIDPSYQNSPTEKLKTFSGTSQENTDMIDKIMQAAPQATPEEVVNILEQQGIQI